MSEIWLDKYRPKKLDQVVGNHHIISKLKILSKKKQIPHLILQGPPGCGKTTSILCLCREVLDKQFEDATLELNASDERGINVVRTKIKNFATKVVNLPKNVHKVIILDEADSMTSGA